MFIDIEDLPDKIRGQADSRNDMVHIDGIMKLDDAIKNVEQKLIQMTIEKIWVREESGRDTRSKSINNIKKNESIRDNMQKGIMIELDSEFIYKRCLFINMRENLFFLECNKAYVCFAGLYPA